MRLFLQIYLFVFLSASAFGQNKNKPVLYDNWPIVVPSFTEKYKKQDGNDLKYVPVGATWGKRFLTYFFENGTADITGNDERQAVRDGFTIWAAATDLYFLEVCSAASADILVSWRTGDHGDGFPFDGVSNTLAHAFFPAPIGNPFPGDIHFDDDEAWTLATRTGTAQPIDLVTVATHEIGHSLGLDHTSVSEL